MPTALFLSPHLDDVAFSCGGTLACLSDKGWTTVLATAFTKSVPEPTGFALECQLDKGLPPGTDYMALRRGEDSEFATRASVTELRWLDHPEAPHRGYESAPALFAGPYDSDSIWEALARDVGLLLHAYAPDAVFAPQALGGHVDHYHLVRAVLEAGAERVLLYRDLPYAARAPDSRPSPLLPPGLVETSVDITVHLETKLTAAAAYGSQIGFQFGSATAMREELASFAADEAQRKGGVGAAEVFLAGEPTVNQLGGVVS